MASVRQWKVISDADDTDVMADLNTKKNRKNSSVSD
jgi:hypothetical protein